MPAGIHQRHVCRSLTWCLAGTRVAQLSAMLVVPGARNYVCVRPGPRRRRSSHAR